MSPDGFFPLSGPDFALGPGAGVDAGGGGAAFSEVIWVCTLGSSTTKRSITPISPAVKTKTQASAKSSARKVGPRGKKSTKSPKKTRTARRKSSSCPKNARTAAFSPRGQKPPLSFDFVGPSLTGYGKLGEFSLQGPAMQPQKPRRLADIPVTFGEYAIDMFPFCTR